ncbi:hypothetical protein HCU64_07740 [Methylobacterium sp. C25]|uniref:HNH endonuclease n=1 Tax=Methylobacterium sp. C25 TaxID=2721622 RepID=UPI001F29D40E|nr:HNH endonuclease [Methylobacterium sp. C25]MCE4223638.1 hypothetical protein [Methylobacterium sp. C25]
MTVRATRVSFPYRLAHHDDFPGAIVIPDQIVRKLNSRVHKAGDNECWRYIPTRPFRFVGILHEPNPARYFGIQWTDPETGFFQSVPAHRLALIQDSGPISPDLLACHLCANPWCCNPAHLYEGTYKQNAADRVLMEAILRHRGTTKGVVLPRHPRSQIVCEELISGVVDVHARSASVANLSGRSLFPSRRPRPARAAVQHPI